LKKYTAKYVIGDIHGHWDVIQAGFYQIDMDNVLYIQIGDFNIGYNPVEIEMKNLKILDNILESTDSDMWIIRGNHDNPFWFQDGEFDQYKAQLKRIRFIKDGTTEIVDGEKYFFLGGANSIDRLVRQKDSTTTWWKEEVIDFDNIVVPADTDRMFAHTAPNICEPFTLGPLVTTYSKYRFDVHGTELEGDKKLVNDLTIERQKMTDIVKQISNLKSYFYGHFHHPYVARVEGCHYRCVDIDEFFEF